MDYKGYRTAFGSRATINHISDKTHPFGVQALAAGLNVLGKTNTPELGLLATTESLAFGPSRNPWDLSRSSGGSSGGSAAAVASGMVASAQGSDGGGSLRVPSSCCGIFALKPSRGRNVDDKPVEPWHISVKGHITRTVRDSAALFALTEQQGASAHFPAVGFVNRQLDRKLKIGLVMRGINGKKPSPDVEAEILSTAKLCESLGHEVIETSFPFDGERLVDAFIAIWSSYAAGFKAGIEQQTGKPAGEDILEPWTLYMDEYFHTGGEAYMETAKSYFAEITTNLDGLTQQYDVLLSPVLSTAAPKLGLQGPLVPGDQLKQDALAYVNYTPVYNISGQPAMSVPLGWNAQGLPVGSQFAARKGNEKLLFELAYQLETARSWHQRWAPHSAARLG
jgi:amidase